MQYIQRISKYMTWGCNLWLVNITLTSCFIWLIRDGAWAQQFFQYLGAHSITTGITIKTALGVRELSSITLTPLTRSIGLLSDLIGNLPVLLGLIIVKRLLRNYYAGNVFCLDNAHQYKHLGFLLLLKIFLSPIASMLRAMIFTTTKWSDHIFLDFSSFSLETFLSSIFLILISKIMIEAYKLQEDKNLTI